jgi:hypothetical protein
VRHTKQRTSSGNLSPAIPSAVAAIAPAAAAEAAIAAASSLTITTKTSAARARLALLGFVHAQRTAVEIRPVQLRDGSARGVFARHHDERETARTAGLTIEHELGLENLSALGEGARHGVFGRVKRKVSYVQSVVHVSLSRGELAPAGASNLPASAPPLAGSVAAMFAAPHKIAAGETTFRDLEAREPVRRLPKTL